MIEAVKDIAEYASKSGAEFVKLASARDIVVEDRVVFRCMNCENYGRNRSCPPFSPGVEVFRKVLSDYSYVLVMGFKSSISSSIDVEEAKRLWDSDKKRVFNTLIAIEKYAFNKGFPLAYVLRAGACNICSQCDTSSCRHQELLRYPICSVGVNIVKTLRNLSVNIEFPSMKPSSKPFLASILLID
jgi:predicted metal-binding protein